VEVPIAVVDGDDHTACPVWGDRLIQGENAVMDGKRVELPLEQGGRQTDLPLAGPDPVVDEHHHVARASPGRDAAGQDGGLEGPTRERAGGHRRSG
jgi:hypothetical protein